MTLPKNRPKMTLLKGLMIKNIFKNKICVSFFFLLALILLIYGKSLNYDFVYDDFQYLTSNWHIQGSFTQSVKWAFSSFYASNWHPLTWTSHAIDFSCFSQDAGMHHLQNIFFHFLNSLFLLLILLKFRFNFLFSIFVAAVFAVHPLHVESVAWLSERKDLLSTFFVLISIYSYLFYTETNKKKLYFLFCLFFVFSLMSKAMYVTLPIILLILDYGILKRFNKDAFIEKIFPFCASVIISIITIYAQKNALRLDIFPFHLRVYNGLLSYFLYIFKIFIPINLSCFYPYPTDFSFLKFCIVFLLFVFSLFLIFKSRKTNKYFFVCASIYIISLVPVIGIVQVGEQQMADRYSYFASIFIVSYFSFWIYDFGFKHLKENTAKILCKFFASLTLIIFTYLSFIQSAYWKNDKILFKHALSVTKNNYVAYNNLGVFFLRDKKYNLAQENFIKALEIKPNFNNALNNLGVVLAAQKKYDKAQILFLRVLKSVPKHLNALINLGNVFLEKAQYDEAENCFAQALRISPKSPKANKFFALTLMFKRQRQDEAILHFLIALKYIPNDYLVHGSLSFLYEEKGDFKKALYHTKKALTIKPNDYLSRKRLKIFEEKIR